MAVRQTRTKNALSESACYSLLEMDARNTSFLLFVLVTLLFLYEREGNVSNRPLGCLTLYACFIMLFLLGWHVF